MLQKKIPQNIEGKRTENQKEKKDYSRELLMKAIVDIKEKFKEVEIISDLHVKDRFENLKEQKLKR